MAKDRTDLRKSIGGGLLRRPPGALLQFGALCHRAIKTSDGLEVLLITTRETHRWGIPKGWPMAGKPPHRVARKEALQEAGVIGRTAKDTFGTFSYIKCLPDGSRVPCVVDVHLLRVERMTESFKEAGQRVLHWCPCSEAASKVAEPELKDLFELLHDRYATGRL